MTDIDAIRQREQAATPGPWEVFGATKDDDGRDALIVCHTAGDRTDPAPLAEVPFNVGDEPGDVGADAEFIAAARTDVPDLLAKVAELTAALTQSRAQAATYANEIGTLTAENARLRQQRDGLIAKVEEIGTALDQADEKNAQTDSLNAQYHGYGARLLYAAGKTKRSEPVCPACDKPGRHPETCPTVTVELPAEATR